MAKNDELNDFKVVDKRHSASTEENEENEETKKGDGFVMRDADKNEKAAPNPTQIDFSTFTFSLATGALIHLGLAPDPVTNKTQKNIELAKQNIDILGLLKEKTKGNLSKDEDTLLEGLLTEIRLRFVEASKN
jgi:hypothetical protein